MYMLFFVYVPIEVLLCCTLVGACGPKAMNKILLSCYPINPTSNGSWRQGIKGEMTCTGYVALVWNII